jgi:hypothetical protein
MLSGCLGLEPGGCRCEYHRDDFNAFFVYSTGDCEDGGSRSYNVPPETVLESVWSKNPIRCYRIFAWTRPSSRKGSQLATWCSTSTGKKGSSWKSLTVVSGLSITCQPRGISTCVVRAMTAFRSPLTYRRRLGRAYLKCWTDSRNTFAPHNTKNCPLYLPEFAALSFPVKDQEEFAKWARESGFPGELAVIEFKPESVNAVHDKTFGDVYEIYGLAKSQSDGKILGGHRITRAILRSGRWYLVGFFRLPPG